MTSLTRRFLPPRIRKGLLPDSGAPFYILNKQDVTGGTATPLFAWLSKSCHGEIDNYGGEIKWNFEKFLLNRKGKPVLRLRSPHSSYMVEGRIRRILGLPYMVEEWEEWNRDDFIADLKAEGERKRREDPFNPFTVLGKGKAGKGKMTPSRDAVKKNQKIPRELLEEADPRLRQLHMAKALAARLGFDENTGSGWWEWAKSWVVFGGASYDL